jgi:hypothetical protein
MRINIYIDRITALNAGLDDHGERAVTVPAADFQPWERTLLAQHVASAKAQDRGIDFDLSCAWTSPYADVNRIASEGTPEAVHTILAAMRAIDEQRAIERANAKAARAEAERAAIEQFLADSPDDLLCYHAPDETYYYRRPSWADERVVARVALLDAECERLGHAAQMARIDAQAAEERRAARAMAERRGAIADWIEAHGTESQRVRLRDGLLPEQEALDAIEEWSFAPLRDVPRYEPLTDRDVCTCDPSALYDVYTCAVTHETRPSGGLADAPYRRLVEIRAAMPDAEVIALEHVGVGPKCEASTIRQGIMVKVRCGPFAFAREYSPDVPTTSM